MAQKKKQEELKARRDLELQRKLEKDRHQSHIEGEYRRHEGNLVTKCPRAKSSRVRVVRTEEKLLPAQVGSGYIIILLIVLQLNCTMYGFPILIIGFYWAASLPVVIVKRY